RRAIDRHERTMTACTQIVDLPRNQLLTHTALALERPVVEQPPSGSALICRRTSSVPAGGSARNGLEARGGCSRRRCEAREPTRLIRMGYFWMDRSKCKRAEG